jgi:putative transposase
MLSPSFLRKDVSSVANTKTLGSCLRWNDEAIVCIRNDQHVASNLCTNDIFRSYVIPANAHCCPERFSENCEKVLRVNVIGDEPESANSNTETRNMFRISRMHELMKALPRDRFERMVRTHEADKHSKGYGAWQQLVAMVYGQVAAVSSLRELEAGFNGQLTHHYHLGCTPVRRSTMADANAKRGPAVFATVVQALMPQVERRARSQIRDLLVAIDSTSITLKGRGFDSWTKATRTRHTQGLKLHVSYALDSATPIDQNITAPNINDIEEATKLPLIAGTTYLFDKGYCDYTWWHRIDQAKAFFVTRFKRNAGLSVVRQRRLPRAAQGIVLEDAIVCFKHAHPRAGRRHPYQQALRRLVIARPDKPDQPLLLATNDLRSPALRIAEHYKARWQVELFFKWIKQHLRIRRFLGRSPNAVRIQILTALISYLLLALYRQKHRLSQSLWSVLSEVRATLFQRPAIEAYWYRKRKQQREAFAQLQPALFT